MVRRGWTAKDPAFEVCAHGDLDGNAVVSTFARGAVLLNGQPKLSTELFINNEFE